MDVKGLHMLVGPPGCGKTTWALEQIECIHLETDKFYAQGRQPVYVVMAVAIVRAFDSGAHTVIADGTHATGFYRAATLAAAREAGDRRAWPIAVHAHVWGNYGEAMKRNEARRDGEEPWTCVPVEAWRRTAMALNQEVITPRGRLWPEFKQGFASVTVEKVEA